MDKWPCKVYGWCDWQMAEELTMGQLLELRTAVEAEVAAKGYASSSYVFHGRLREKIAAVDWAIQRKVAAENGGTIQGATFKNYKTRR